MVLEDLNGQTDSYIIDSPEQHEIFQEKGTQTFAWSSVSRIGLLPFCCWINEWSNSCDCFDNAVGLPSFPISLPSLVAVRALMIAKREPRDAFSRKWRGIACFSWRWIAFSSCERSRRSSDVPHNLVILLKASVFLFCDMIGKNCGIDHLFSSLIIKSNWISTITTKRKDFD